MSNYTTRRAACAVVSDCSLLVASCDAYADLWRPFFALLHRHWPDCPFQIFLGAGKLTCEHPHVTTLSSEGGKDWSRCMTDYLHQISTRFVVVMLDDFFLRRRTLTSRVLECLEFARKYDAIQVRLVPLPGPTDRLDGQKLIGECASGLPYRLSTQAAIWDRGKLMELLRAGESIWEFEHRANVRAYTIEHGFYAVNREVLPYLGVWAHHVVEKGKWLPYEKWLFGRQDIGCDFSRRGTLPIRKALIYQCIVILDDLLRILPWPLKKAIKKTIKCMLFPLLGRQFAHMSGNPR